MNYSIENLIETFTKHVDEYEKNLIKWKAEHPDQAPLSDFILPRALLSIVTEIKQIKDKYEANQPEISSDMPRKESKNTKMPISRRRCF